jgi:hypothetical protein
VGFNIVAIRVIDYNDLGLGLDKRGIRVQFPRVVRDFSLLHNMQTSSGPTHPPIQWVPGTVFLGMKQQGCEADHSPPLSVEVNGDGAIPTLFHMSSWRGA